MLNGMILEFRSVLSSPEAQYMVLIFALFVLPKFLIRLGIPFAISAFGFGFGASAIGFDFFDFDVVKLLATLGIVSLFLLAGLEVEVEELQKRKTFLIQHVLVYLATFIVAGLVLVLGLGLDVRPGLLLALAILTPSTGFILDSLDSSKVPEDTKFWIRSKAIAAEIVALLLMFVLVKSMSITEFLLAAGGMGLLILALPFSFRFFVRVIAPFAPRSEFGFLLMAALLSGLITKKLGAYYLVGAFIVGIVARRFEGSLPRLTSKSMLKAIKFFSSFFIPFYFFRAGFLLSPDQFTLKAIGIGLLLLIIFIPLRFFSVVWHRRIFFGERNVQNFPIAASLLPNLVFGLVLADLIQSLFKLPPPFEGALITYTLGATLAPPLLMRFFWHAPEYKALAEAEGNLGGSTWESDGSS